MTDPVWWYVLAGFILGFILSTLWEWLFFRRRRMRIESQRIAELEESVRTLTTTVHATDGSAAASYAAGYQSPGVFLEGEEDELDTAEVIVPAPDVYAQPAAARPQSANGNGAAHGAPYTGEPSSEPYGESYTGRAASEYAGPAAEPYSSRRSRTGSPATGAAVPFAAATAAAATAAAAVVHSAKQQPEPTLPAEDSPTAAGAIPAPTSASPLDQEAQPPQPVQPAQPAQAVQPLPQAPPTQSDQPTQFDQPAQQPAHYQPASYQPAPEARPIEPEQAPWLTPENVAAISAALGSTLRPDDGALAPQVRNTPAGSPPAGQPTPEAAPSQPQEQFPTGTYPTPDSAPPAGRPLPRVYDLPDTEPGAAPPPPESARTSLRAILPPAAPPMSPSINGSRPRPEQSPAGDTLVAGGLEPELEQASDTLSSLIASLNSLIAKTQSLLDRAGKQG